MANSGSCSSARNWILPAGVVIGAALMGIAAPTHPATIIGGVGLLGLAGWMTYIGRSKSIEETDETARHYRQLLEGLPHLTWTCNSNADCDFFSQKWLEYTGVKLDEHIGSKWQRAVHPDDLPRLLEAWRNTAKTGEPLHLEYRLRRYDGSYRWFDTRALPLLDKSGKVVHWFGTSLDVEDRRQAEHRFRRLYESNLVGIVFSRSDGEFTAVNDAMLELLGYKPEEKPKLNWNQLTPPEWQAREKDQLDRLKQKGRSGTYEKELFRKDGTRVPVLMSSADGARIDSEEFVSFVIDLQRIKHVEEALRRTESNLRLLNDSLERRVRERTSEVETRSEQLRALALDLAETESRERKRLAQLLHDHFQQLVSAAKLKAGILRRKFPESGQTDQIKQIEALLEEAIHASRTLAMELSPPVLHDAGLGAAIAWLTRRMEHNHDLYVHLDLDPNTEPDNEQVRTILFECIRELLFNVVKHSGADRANLSVRSPQAGWLQVRVKDAGKGFDPDRVEIALKPDGSFGLMSIKERLNMIGGQLSIDSRPDQGTIVEMNVPVTMKPSGESVERTGSVETDDSRGVLNIPPVRVIVADDHKVFREGLISMLSQEPYITIIGQAGDGQEALELVHRLQPDILIVDITMPNLNGVQVTQRVTREVPNTQVVGLSMHEREDMAQAMRDAGAVAYCTKAGETETLLNILRNVALSRVVKDVPAN